MDVDPDGASYAPGELLLADEPDLPDEARTRIPEEVGARVEKDLPPLNAQLLEFPEVAAEPAQQRREEALERIRRSLEQRSGVEAADYNYLRTTSFTPNDTYFDDQYGLKIARFPEGWDYSRGLRVRVGVVDTGIDQSHPDLGDKILAARNFTTESSVDDGNGHGTHVAGIAAAVTNNGRGVAGACPRCGLLIAKALTSSGVGYDSDVADGIVWTVDNGARVVNLSLGGSEKSRTLEKAVNYAWDNGAVVAAAAGNESTSDEFYPAAYENAIAVAATDQDDQPASFSNFGDWIDVAAPGVRIRSTFPGGYGDMSGTGMATPHVAGLAGLLAAQGRNNVVSRARIEKLAEDLGAEGKDPRYGHGRIDAARSAYRYRQVVDNAQPRFRASNNWRVVTGSSQRFGEDYRLTRPAGINDSALFRHRVPSTGRYTVCAWWAAHPRYNERATFAIETTDGYVRRAADQRENGGRWNCLGRFKLAGGDDFYVRLLRRTPGEGYLIADAVLILGV